MGVESIAAFDDIIVQHAQGAEVYFLPVMPVSETKRMVAIEPAEIYVASF